MKTDEIAVFAQYRVPDANMVTGYIVAQNHTLTLVDADTGQYAALKQILQLWVDGEVLQLRSEAPAMPAMPVDVIEAVQAKTSQMQADINVQTAKLAELQRWLNSVKDSR